MAHVGTRVRGQGARAEMGGWLVDTWEVISRSGSLNARSPTEHVPGAVHGCSATSAGAANGRQIQCYPMAVR